MQQIDESMLGHSHMLHFTHHRKKAMSQSSSQEVAFRHIQPAISSNWKIKLCSPCGKTDQRAHLEQEQGSSKSNVFVEGVLDEATQAIVSKCAMHKQQPLQEPAHT